jgi:hypothetical protein
VICFARRTAEQWCGVEFSPVVVVK